MATTTPKPTEDSPTGDSVTTTAAATPPEATRTAEASTDATRPVSAERRVMETDSEIERLARYAEEYEPPRMTFSRATKMVLYFLLFVALTFVFLVLMQGVAHTDDVALTGAIASGATSSSSDVRKWIEDGLPAFRARKRESHSESPEASRIPSVEQTPRNEPVPMEPTPMPNPEREPSAETERTAEAPRVMQSMRKPDPAREARLERVAHSLPALELQGIGAIADDALPWMETLDLALSLEIEFKGRAPHVDARVLRAELYHELIDLSVRVGHTDDPHENLEAIRGFMASKLGFTPVLRDVYPLEMIRPGTVLDGRRGSPRGIAILALILADRVNPYLELEPVSVGSVLGLRYRSGSHRYTLVPRDLSRLYGDRELIEFALGKDALGDVTVMSRRQFWGTVFTEVGTSLLEEGDIPRGTDFIERGLGLHGTYPLAHVAKARVELRNNDLESAREELDLAVRLDPGSAAARTARFRLLGKHGHSQTIEDDLVWLTRNGSDPETGLWLAEHLLDVGRYADARREVERVEARPHLSPALTTRAAGLHRRIEVAPWVAVLKDPARNQRLRFEALEQLEGRALPEVLETLAHTLDDDNIRLARLAWKLLEELTGWELAFDSAVWLETLERERRLAPSPSH